MFRKMICFDMDGSIARTYDVDNWLNKLQHEDSSPYAEAKPMWDMNELNEILMLLAKEGWEIRVISWLSKDSSESYKKDVREAKQDWLNRYNFPSTHNHFVRYGATKADSVRKKTDYAILIDDNKKVREGWSLGDTVDPTTADIIEVLYSLLEDNDYDY